MAQDDYAIVVGLQHYPGLVDEANGKQPLAGPENDANAFYDWLISSDGGALPEGHVEKILSSKYDHTNSPLAAKPVASDVENAFRNLLRISAENVRQNRGLRVGRRLYIFMAGHGIAPDRYGENKAEWEAALLMANVEPPNVSATFHIPGAYTASWFASNDYFDEIFLFMDCCRESALVQGLNYFLPQRGNSTNSKRCFIFGTRWSRSSRERPMEDENNKVRGIFSKTLLLGLDGAASQPVDNTNMGVITVASLRSYLFQNMKEFMLPEDLTGTDLQEPDFDHFPNLNEGRDFIIKPAVLQRFPVTFFVPAGATGNLTIRFGGNVDVAVFPINNAPAEIRTELARGSYTCALAINGNATLNDFDIRGIEGRAGKGGLDVRFN